MSVLSVLTFRIRSAPLRVVSLWASCLTIYGSAQAVIHADPSLKYRLASEIGKRNPEQKISVGLPIPPKIVKFTGSNPKHILLIMVDTCIKCSYATVVRAENIGRLAQSHNLSVVVVSRDNSGTFEQFMRDKVKPRYCHVISDETGEIAAQLGVRSLPQVAEFQDGQLVWSKERNQFFRDAINDRLKRMGLGNHIGELDKPLQESQPIEAAACSTK